MSKITNDGFPQIWHRMLYSCSHMAAVGVKGLIWGLKGYHGVIRLACICISTVHTAHFTSSY